MKKTLSLVVVFGIVVAGAAFAQTTATTPRVNPPAAVIATSPDAKGAASPVAGANSFTESEARARLEANGYTKITGLEKDDKSVWRGKAMKLGASVNVSLDYQGTIVAN